MSAIARNQHALEIRSRASEAGTQASGRRGAGLAPRAWAAIQWLLALLALIFVLPLMLATALAVLLQDGGPVLFRQQRIGRGGETFACLKFRTMVVDAEARLAELLSRDAAALEEWEREQKLRKDPRITQLGRFLRVSSIDELPQLINVLRGEMNLVGPRPIVESEIARYGRRFRCYGAVKPGITGLWQVSGRNDVAYATRVALDTLYALRRSPGLDLWIIYRTVPAVLFRQGSR
ncbi:sugar transferase [Phenylobacterium sp. LjRoot219]|uniref:sugar transferase n=1 Tax=Phenylobacterium sp. LjRoot219 TaxID=3342283 RepID=UPI003ED0B76A